MGDFRDLRVWKQAHQMALQVYRVTQDFPSHERYGLTSQMRRAAVSISANIAESRGRPGIRDQHRFLHIAQGSARELECLLLLAGDLGLAGGASVDGALARIEAIERMLAKLIGSKP